jgi:RNA recognition motif-containing protein
MKETESTIQRKIFLGGLPSDATIEDLTKAFSRYG